MVVALKEQSCSARATALFDVCFATDLLPSFYVSEDTFF
jgi:hypothetical protein